MTDGLIARILIRRSDRFSVDVDFSIERGETLALLGPNGAGKTTIVSAIAGLIHVDAGTVSVDGRILFDSSSQTFVSPELRNIGVVFQDYLLFPHLRVDQNVAFGLRSHGVNGDEARRIAGEWLDRVGLDGLGHLGPDQLSGGQAQRVAVARALAPNPSALLLDEPLAALDVTTRSEMRHFLKRHLNTYTGPRLLITHDPAEAFLLGDRIAIIAAGKITQIGSPDDIRLRPQTRYAADLAGVNLFHGVAEGGVVAIGGHSVHVADVSVSGAVLVSFSPAAVAVHESQPGGSPRNAWPTVVERVEPLGSRVRLLTGGPLAVAVEVTEAARTDLHIEEGTPIWIAVKATEISVEPFVGS